MHITRTKLLNLTLSIMIYIDLHKIISVDMMYWEINSVQPNIIRFLLCQERWKKVHRLPWSGENKEVWQLNAMWNPGLDAGPIKGCEQNNWSNWKRFIIR